MRMWNQLLLSGKNASGVFLGICIYISFDIYISQDHSGRNGIPSLCLRTTANRCPTYDYAECARRNVIYTGDGFPTWNLLSSVKTKRIYQTNNPFKVKPNLPS